MVGRDSTYLVKGNGCFDQVNAAVINIILFGYNNNNNFTEEWVDRKQELKLLKLLIIESCTLAN